MTGACSWCDPSDGFCKKGLPCGTDCHTDSDCDQKSNCTTCPRGKCMSPGMCNNYCLSGADCVSFCTTCSQGECKSECGKQCAADIDCGIAGSSCAKCINQVCQAGGCGAACSQDLDCAREGNCTHCVNNKCGSTCGGKCVTDTECAGDFTGCGHCNSYGLCAPGTCGSQCRIGNNNGCLGSQTCTQCSVNSTCQIGQPCYSKCVANTDCDQQGTCVLCSSHGYCVGAAEMDLLPYEINLKRKIVVRDD